MTIRRLLTTLLTLMGLLIVIGSSWELNEAQAKRSATQWVLQSNRLADLTLRNSGVMAMERGITSAILSHPAQASPDMLYEMAQQRHTSDVLHQEIVDAANQLIRLSRQATDHPIRSGLAELEHHYAELKTARHSVDLRLANDTTALNETRWISVATQLIDALTTLRNATSHPMTGNIYSHTTNPVIKDVLFTISEYAGRERALVGAAISQQRTLSAGEHTTLRRYRYIVEASLERLEQLLQQLPPNPELAAAQEAMHTHFLTGFGQLRQTIYAADHLAISYPISAGEWYLQATHGISTVLALSEAVSDHFSASLDRLDKNVTLSVLLVAISILTAIGIFLFAVWSIRRRILAPLQRLETAVKRVANGALNAQLPRFRHDEIGSLAHAFEEMRVNLVDDIERREANEAELRKLNQAIDQSVSSIIITNINGITEYVNPQYVRTTGYQADEVIGKHLPLLKTGVMPRRLYQDMRRALQQGEVWEGEMRNRRKNGEEYWELTSISPVRNPHGIVTHFVGIQYDISERKRMEEQINRLAYYDELTQLPNRALLAKRFEQIARHALRRNQRAALLSIDISRFHLINDSLGHRTGDKVLQAVGQRLQECARQNDIVARYAGDEFVVILPDAPDYQGIATVAQRMISNVQRPLIIEGHELNISMHAGISVLPDDGEDLATLLGHATTAQHMAAREADKRFCFFTEELNTAAWQRLELEQDLRRALTQQSLELHYQPKVNMTSGAVVGVEALARWQHPTKGNISPMHFIPIAEETGLIHALGAWALREACTQAVIWQHQGLPPLTMAVNLSVRQLQQPGLADLVARILRETGLEPGLLELELTESAVMSQPEETIAILTELKALGIRLAIDDFGTGYSSLAYLRRFPFDTLKIDRSFITNITTSTDEAAITQTIIAMSQGLRLETVAEGVETEAQVEFLRTYHCDLMQGYLFSAPLPQKQVTELLMQGRRMALSTPTNGQNA